MTTIDLANLFEQHPMLRSVLCRSVNLNGWTEPAIAIDDRWGMSAASKGAMLDVMRNFGLCNSAKSNLTKLAVNIAARLLS